MTRRRRGDCHFGMTTDDSDNTLNKNLMPERLRFLKVLKVLKALFAILAPRCTGETPPDPIQDPP
jgi:hypothetical protein